MIVGAFKVFGVSEWSARFGPALCGLLTIAAVWCVGREIDREEPRGFAFWSVVVSGELSRADRVLTRGEFRRRDHDDDDLGARVFSST